VSIVVIKSIMPLRNAHELWTKLQEKYGVSNTIEDDCSPSTSGRDEFSTSSTSPTCGKPQAIEMVGSDRFCNNDSELIIDDPSSLSYCNASSMDLNTTSTKNDLLACVDGPCISCSNCLTKSHDDMLVLSCCHDKNACASSSPCVTNNVEETQLSMEQDVNLSGASSNVSSSSTIFCLMAKDSKVSPTLNPIESNDDNDNDEEDDNVSSIKRRVKLSFMLFVRIKMLVLTSWKS